MKNKKLKTKQLKVNKSFMTDYLRALFLLSFAVICFLLVSHHLSLGELKAAIISQGTNPEILNQIVAEQAAAFYKTMIVTMVCFFVAVCILTTQLAKKVSSPVEELIEHFSKFGHISEVKKIRFKKGNAFEELMKSFNFLVQRQGGSDQQVAVHNYRGVLK
ncbi:MAG: methyl-accepting chemotaxis protein [Bacteriovoracaceae bacterium]|jgi:methyl-accepting chemotaxis protein